MEVVILMKLLSQSMYEIKKSKFIAYYYEIESSDEVKSILTDLKKEHSKAKHLPYAYLLNNTAGKSDDGEPSNTCGLPLFNLLERKKLTNRLIVVVRYFGGTKLGAGNLLRSYLNTANECITKTKQ